MMPMDNDWGSDDDDVDDDDDDDGDEDDVDDSNILFWNRLQHSIHSYLLPPLHYWTLQPPILKRN